MHAVASCWSHPSSSSLRQQKVCHSVNTIRSILKIVEQPIVVLQGWARIWPTCRRGSSRWRSTSGGRAPSSRRRCASTAGAHSAWGAAGSGGGPRTALGLPLEGGTGNAHGWPPCLPVTAPGSRASLPPQNHRQLPPKPHPAADSSCRRWRRTSVSLQRRCTFRHVRAAVDMRGALPLWLLAAAAVPVLPANPPLRPPAALQLLVQDARLHMAAGGSPEHVALVLYQCGTLQARQGVRQWHTQGILLRCACLCHMLPPAPPSDPLHACSSCSMSWVSTMQRQRHCRCRCRRCASTFRMQVRQDVWRRCCMPCRLNGLLYCISPAQFANHANLLSQFLLSQFLLSQFLQRSTC